MRPLRTTAAVLGAMLALAASGCGGSEGVPEGAVAVVNGVEITKAELDELIGIAKKAYEAQDREFPRVGTPEYQSIQQQYLAYLVQREEFEQEAEKLGVEVTERDIDRAFAEVVRTRYDGDRAELEKALADQGLTIATFRETLRASVLSQKLFEAVTKDVRVGEDEILLYYTQNQAQYQTPDSRDVRHILIAEKGSDGQVDYARSKEKADEIYRQLRAGADFAELARRKSADPGSKDQGGKLTISRGQTVAAFDKTAFSLPVNGLSRPVRTEYGYHVIQALSPVRKGRTTKLDDVRESIRQTLLQERRNERMREWIADLERRYQGKVRYAAGYEPPALPEDPEETETE
ncbi:MAG: peptidylprolyl isomerase [Thermoleophilia bacterium]|nr:peptidylprolyl isomerase [Gaiellaceae bacterium]MDW8339284.1 peptidylprolyl isomerase [Thermoleophilia bacterium]